MEILYRTEGFRQYMMLEAEELNLHEFEWNMLLHFEGESLLPVQLQWKNGKGSICYEMSGAVAVEQYFEQKKIGIRELQQLFQAYLNAYEEMETYLLLPDGLLLNPKYIFYLPGQQYFRFCYYPREEGNALVEVAELAEYCMKHTKHQDSEAVLFIYGLYHQLQEESIDVKGIKEYVQEFGTQDKKTDAQETECSVTRKDIELQEPLLSDNEEPIVLMPKEMSQNRQVWFYVYIGLSGIVVLLDGFFAVRFLAVTRNDFDIKISIVLTIVLMVLVYSAIQANRKRRVSSQSMNNAVEKEGVSMHEKPVEFVRECMVNEMIEEKESCLETVGRSEPSYSDLTYQKTLIGEGETVILETNQSDTASVWELQEQEGADIRIQLNRLPGVVGRKISEVDYVITGEGVSRRHALLFLSGEALYVQDLGSTNGTYVNGVRLSEKEPMQLRETDELMIGGNRYLVRLR